MCGIAGLLAPAAGHDGEALAAVAGAMAGTLVHRGPDDAGTWVDPPAGLAFGHRRLAVLELSPRGAQPMASDDGRYVLSYNGEIYDHRELRAELAARGRRFRGASDTEVLLAAVAEWGVDAALRRANGMFAFALWDRRERTLDLVRDRLGQKPLYWAWTAEGFAFASELRALLAAPGFSPEVDRDALTLLLRRGAIAAPWSVFRQARKLLPGHRLRVTAGDVAAGRRRVDERPYWSVTRVFEEGAARPLAGDDGELTDAVEALLGDAVEAATVSDVPLGAFLSGGVDSSLVVALLAARGAAPRTFTIGFGDPRYDESAAAAAIAGHLGTRHETLRVGEEEALAVVPELPAIYDEPLADSSQVPTVLLARLARRHVTVALSGDGGDELFAGYEHYRLLARLAALGRLPRPLLAAGAATLARLPGGGRPARLGRFLAAAPSLDEVHLRLVSVWKRPADLVLGAAEPPALLVRPEEWPRIADPVRRAQALDAATYLPDDVLAKVDRAAMAVSLETRVPLLDHRVVELAARLPARLVVRGGRGKWVLRRVLARHLPAELFDRPKRGFSVPLDAWLRGALRDWAEALLAPERLRREGVFAVDAVRGVWQDHLAGRGDRGLYLWPLLAFQAWRERWGGGAVETAGAVAGLAAPPASPP